LDQLLEEIVEDADTTLNKE